MKKIFSISIIPLFTLLIFSGASFGDFWDAQKSTITWSPPKVEEEQFSGTVKILTAKFISKKDLENVKFWLTPRLNKYTTIEPESIEKVEKDKEYNVQIVVSLPSDITKEKTLCEHLKDLSIQDLDNNIDKDDKDFLFKCPKNKIPGLLFVTSEKTVPWFKFWHKEKEHKIRVIHPKALKIMIIVKEPSVEEIPIDEISLPTVERIYEDEETGAVYVRDEVVIRFKENTSETRIKEIISTINGKFLGHISDIEIYQVLVPIFDPSELESIIQQLETHPEVAIATYHWIYESF